MVEHPGTLATPGAVFTRIYLPTYLHAVYDGKYSTRCGRPAEDAEEQG